MFGEKAKEILPSDGKWLTRTQHGLEISSEHVVVATGLNRVPQKPTYEGEAGFTGRRIRAGLPGPRSIRRATGAGGGNGGTPGLRSRSISARLEWIRPFRCGARSTSSPVTSWDDPPS